MSEKLKELLPVGSIVNLKNGKKRLMIFGILQRGENAPGEEFDYSGVPYPEGNMGTDYQYLFNHEDVDHIYFRGYDDIERVAFIEKLEEYYQNQENS